jgi:hypothetical protein
MMVSWRLYGQATTAISYEPENKPNTSLPKPLDGAAFEPLAFGVHKGSAAAPNQEESAQKDAITAPGGESFLPVNSPRFYPVCPGGINPPAQVVARAGYQNQIKTKDHHAKEKTGRA